MGEGGWGGGGGGVGGGDGGRLITDHVATYCTCAGLPVAPGSGTHKSLRVIPSKDLSKGPRQLFRQT